MHSGRRASVPDNSDFTDLYNTPLSNGQEASFQSWLRTTGKQNDLRDYDLRGAFASGVAKDPRGHLPDTWKKPNHPTFSTESKYNGVNGAQGGEWVKSGDGWQFKASPFNVGMRGKEGLREYFQEVEPDSKLILPGDPQ